MSVHSRSPRIIVRGVHSPLTSFDIRIIGGYPFEDTIHTDNKVLKVRRIFEEASLKYKNKNIIISYSSEPLLFLNLYHLKLKTNATINLSWFDFLHTISDKFNFPANQVTLITSNIYAKKSYDDWFKQTNYKIKLNVVEQKRFYWLSRLIDAGFKYQADVIEDKHFSMFVGRPRFQRHPIVKWYLDKIISTENNDKMITTFLYGNFNPPQDWDIDKFKKLNGTIETNSLVHPDLSLPWSGDSNMFSKTFAKGVLNFCIDYVEHEDFSNYDDYKKFKKDHSWWHEDMLSEKLFKCVIFKRPFIRLGMPHSLKRFKEWGFKTFDGILFDERYDDMEDFYDRLNCIIPQVEKYLSMSLDELKEKVYSAEVQKIVEHNYNLAYEIYNNKEGKIDV